jgi:hypothetical protein
MTGGSLRFDARIAGSLFAPKERVPFALLVANDGSDVVAVPDPFLGGPALVLVLRGPRGVKSMAPGEVPPVHGIPRLPGNRAVLPGAVLEMGADLATLFDLGPPGRYTLVAEYTVPGLPPFRSSEIVFDRAEPAGLFLDAAPDDCASLGTHSLGWVERDGQTARALTFDLGRGDGHGHAHDLSGAEPLAAGLPLDARPLSSVSPAGFGFGERWFVWLQGADVHARFYAHGDPDLSLQTSPVSLSSTGVEHRIIRPPLAAAPPDDGRPGCSIGLLAKGPVSDELQVVEIDAAGVATNPIRVALPTGVVAAWAVAPSETSRVFVLARRDQGRVEIAGLVAPRGEPAHAAVLWHTEDADDVLLGDVRANLEGDLRVGLLLRRGSEWRRVVFGPPRAGETVAREIVSHAFMPPPAAEPVRARLDSDFGLHLLFRQDRVLRYVPPGASAAAWKSDRLGALAMTTAHLVLKQGPRATLVAYDPDQGPVVEVL